MSVPTVRPPAEKKIMLNLPKEDDPDQVAYVSVRPSTTREESVRAQIGSEISRTYREDEKAVEVKYNWTYAQQQRLEAFLTLSDCNLLMADPDDDTKTYPIFRFQRRPDGKMAINMTEADFETAWGILPSAWSEAVHAAVLKVNKHWLPGFRGSK